MRTDNSIKNSITSFISYFIAIIITFISQKIFIHILGIEYLGLNSVFKNLFSILNILDFGMGSVTLFYFYKYIHDNKNNEINSLLKYTKKFYYFVMLFILVVGILITPFLKYIVDVKVTNEIYIIYYLFLISSIVSYLFEYKCSLIIASQKKYILTLIHIFYVILTNIVQIIILLITKNYYLYIITNIIFVLIERFIILKYINKKYNYLNKNDNKELDKNIKKDLFNRMKAYTLDRVATLLVYNTDTILLSIFYGLKKVGIYTNYLFIINGVDALFNGIISSLTPSVGNMLVENDCDKNYDIFKKIKFLTLLISIFTTSMIISLSQDFITIWVGKKYLFSIDILIVLSILFYVNFMKYSYKVFKHGAGIWIEDKFVPVFVALLNIIFSIIFIKLFGLIGVFIGTIFSSIPLYFYDFPKFIYKKLFNKKYINYYKQLIIDILISGLIILVIYYLLSFISFDNKIITLLVKTISGCTLNIIIFTLLFRNKYEYKYFITLIKEKLKRRKL